MNTASMSIIDELDRRNHHSDEKGSKADSLLWQKVKSYIIMKDNNQLTSNEARSPVIQT